jgi:hypothetical protein
MGYYTWRANRFIRATNHRGDQIGFESALSSGVMGQELASDVDGHVGSEWNLLLKLCKTQTIMREVSWRLLGNDVGLLLEFQFEGQRIHLNITGMS